jgi:spermidine/putrescine transport system substrate-binding protein
MRCKKACAVLLLAVSLFSACSGKGGMSLKVFNWGDYIDESVLDDFEKRTGIKVIYDTFATNEDMYVKVKMSGANYDIAIPSDYMIKRMIGEGLLMKIDMANIPNYQYIDGHFKGLAHDPNNEYSVPYMWGTLGIIYNKALVQEPIDSWNILWDERYAKQIIMMDSIRDTLAVALKRLGYSLNTRDVNELEAAKDSLIAQKPLVLAYAGDEVKDKMIAAEASIAVVYSGDAVYMKSRNPDLEYVIPKEGTNLWFDGVVIPVSSKHKREAEMFIDFLCDPEIGLRNTLAIGYSTPNRKTMELLPLEVASEKAAYPDDEALARTEIFDDISNIVREQDRIWTEIKAR